MSVSVDSACTTITPTNLYTYYIKTTSTCNFDLQKKSDDISDVLVELCEISVSIYSSFYVLLLLMYLQKNCKKYNKTVSYQLTEDQDEQKDAINGQLKKIKAQLVFFYVLRKAYSDTTTNEKTLKFNWRNNYQKYSSICKFCYTKHF